MQTQQTITLFGTVSNSATSRISRNGHKYTAFGVSIISDRNLQPFHYNVVAFGKQGHFAKPLQIGTRIKLVIQAQSQPDNIAPPPTPHSNLRATGSSGRAEDHDRGTGGMRLRKH
jgi:hypothetical protein